MTWHVQYRHGAREHELWRPTPELAIEAACKLIDDGVDVYGIGTGDPSDSIAREQINRIHALWVRARRPFGIRRH
jgi:kynurenine formamidase